MKKKILIIILVISVVPYYIATIVGGLTVFTEGLYFIKYVFLDSFWDSDILYICLVM